MADSLKMGGLSLEDSQHAPTHQTGRSPYIPPHLRGQPRSVVPPMGLDGAAPAAPPPPAGRGLNASAWGPGYVILARPSRHLFRFIQFPISQRTSQFRNANYVYE